MYCVPLTEHLYYCEAGAGGSSSLPFLAPHQAAVVEAAVNAANAAKVRPARPSLVSLATAEPCPVFGGEIPSGQWAYVRSLRMQKGIVVRLYYDKSAGDYKWHTWGSATSDSYEEFNGGGSSVCDGVLPRRMDKTIYVWWNNREYQLSLPVWQNQFTDPRTASVDTYATTADGLCVKDGKIVASYAGSGLCETHQYTITHV